MPVNDIKNALRNKQSQLMVRIDAIERDFKKGRSADFEEQTTESENNEVLDEIHHEAKSELRQINSALTQIENDEYGVCIKCTATIATERLKALPYANTCISCAQ
ncbi:MAG: TraR/DksA C4-type zinc finger protein [Colwellia sp.]|nr:TraR/DksA C4-type zinc finger protein [Colwellia sp.]